MDRIGEVARGLRPARTSQGERVIMAGKPVGGDPRNLRISNVQRLPPDCLIDRHSCSLLPASLHCHATPNWLCLTHQRKDGV